MVSSLVLEERLSRFVQRNAFAQVAIMRGPKFKLLHENKLGNGDQFRASPAVVDGQLIIRSDRRLY